MDLSMARNTYVRLSVGDLLAITWQVYTDAQLSEMAGAALLDPANAGDGHGNG